MAAQLGACSFDWDAFDPRIADAPGGGGPATGGAAGAAGSSSASTGGAAQGGGGGVLGPFGPPQAVAEVSSTSDDDDPSFTADLLELLFNSDRGMSADIYVSTRSDAAAPWGAPAPVAELNSSVLDSNCAIAPDGLTVWLSSTRAGTPTAQDIYVSTRPDRTSMWSTPTLVPELNSSMGDRVLGVTGDGLTIVVGSNRMGSNQDLYVSNRPSSSQAWGALMPLTELNTSVEENQGWIDPSGLALWFDRSPAGHHEIFFATRSVTTSPFAMPALVSELNTGGDDTDPWLSSDTRYIMFARGPTGGTRDIYEASR